MPKFFDELDAIPEPGPLKFGSGAVTDEPSICWNCREQVQRVGWHVIPDTLEYSCIPRTQPPVQMRPAAPHPPVRHGEYPPAGFVGWF